ncbi:hypothetical protein BDW42DRAFT_163513 [Aspergillus taichungensis]|uniref:Uncharacterized protein n=1 Tax=Aspergillus taichungensis TaxID=482145 RepID=A0A2J5I2Q3_9EURO|nr:hypothetical protein BDW42DRAFT_163513 [Aspergillus taichungensis]
MVVFVDLENDGLDENHFVENPHALFNPFSKPIKPAVVDAHSTSAAGHADQALESPKSRAMADQPAVNQSSFAAALSCYPILEEIARAVDLNTMHALSRTCRRFHMNLVPYRQQLSKMTLRCESERMVTTADVLGARASQQFNVNPPDAVVRVAAGSAVLRRSKCARDMVAECRKCSKVVCRNCAAKPAASTILKRRIRRLCTTCLKAPLPQLEQPVPSCPTQLAFQRNICTCNVSIWLCQPCFRRLSSDDLDYRHTWSRRLDCYAYGQGMRCWRGKHCLAAQDVERTECELHHSPIGTANPSYGRNIAGSSQENAWEHSQQDTVGIRTRLVGTGGEEGAGDRLRDTFRNGGSNEHTVTKRTMVGAFVDYHEDERQTGDCLAREEAGLDRAWCNWCMRLIPSQLDLDVLQ